MFKARSKATKSALLAGYGSTMPMRIVDINRGWEPGVVEPDATIDLLEGLVVNDPYVPYDFTERHADNDQG